MDSDDSSTSLPINDDVDENRLLGCQSPDSELAEDRESDASFATTSERKERDLGVNTTKSHPPNSKTTPQTCKSDPYTVTGTVTIALAIYTDDPIKPGKKKGTQVGGLKQKTFFHIEYSLLPDNEPTKVDLVLFGLSGEVFVENESKVVKLWRDGDYIWIAWNQPVELNLTKELLFKMQSHDITFRVWDTKDRVPVQVRYGRPRTSKPTQGRTLEDQDKTGGSKGILEELRILYEKDKPKTRASLKGECEDVAVESKAPSSKAGKSTADRKKTQEKKALMKDVHRNGVAWVELSGVHLLAGKRSLTGRLLSQSENVPDGLCSLTLDQPLISEELRVELKPLVITILSASFLPCSPVPFHVLEQECLPVYCQYKFHTAPMHRTASQPHDSRVYFRDVNVIFTGLLSTGELLECLSGPPLQIEVHDRDRKVLPKSPAVFGTGPHDDRLASTSLVNTRRTTHSPFEDSGELQYPHGVADLDLSNLLKGQACLNLMLPIRCSHQGRWWASEETTDDVEERWDNSVPIGHYLEFNSTLNVRVEMQCPLDSDLYKSAEFCPYGRIIYIFHFNNDGVQSRLRSEILRINAAAFQLDSETKETVQKALRGYRMTAEERESTDLNFITGFHLLDNVLQLFVLEGLKDQAIRTLWETVPMKLSEDVENQVTVIYNSNLSFSKRIYDSLDLGLNSIYLYKPLEDILRHSLVYIRDMIPNTCLQAMIRINHICQVKKLRKVVQSSLFPSAEMVLSLSKELGVIPRRDDERLLESADVTQEDSRPTASPRRSRKQLDIINKTYIAWKAQQGFTTKDFVQDNILEVHKASILLRKTKPKVFVAKVEEGQIAYNYSIQKMNSTTLAKELLRKEMAKSPSRRFTYSQHYHSLTVEPVDVEAKKKAMEAKFRTAWRTQHGFFCSGLTGSFEVTSHPRRTHEARVEELRKPWRENILHGKTGSITLNRTPYTWNKRHKDFNLYTKPATTPTSQPAEEAERWGQHEGRRPESSRQEKKPEKKSTGGSSSRAPELRRSSVDEQKELRQDKPIKFTLRKSLKHINLQSTKRTEKKRKSALSGRSQDQNLEVDTLTDSDTIGQSTKSYSRHYWKPHTLQPVSPSDTSANVVEKPPNTETHQG